MRIVKVKDLCEQIRGVSYSSGEASAQPALGLVPLIRANNITDQGLSFEGLVYVPTHRVSDKQLLRKHDIVIAASSGSREVVGKAAQLLLPETATFGAFCKVLRPREGVEPRYVGHFFRTPAYRRRISDAAAGIGINNLRNEDLDDLEIPVPNLHEQKRIASILDAAEALREKRGRAARIARSLLRSIFTNIVGDVRENPNHWPEVELGELIIDGPQNGLYRPGDDYGSGTPILRIDAFYDGVVTGLSTLKRVRLNEREIAKYSLHPRDIVINRVNSREYLGKSAIIPELIEPVVFESNMMRLRLDPQRADARFIVEQLQTGFVKAQILNRSKDAVNQSSINQGDVKSLVLCLGALRNLVQHFRADEGSSFL